MKHQRQIFETWYGDRSWTYLQILCEILFREDNKYKHDTGANLWVYNEKFNVDKICTYTVSKIFTKCNNHTDHDDDDDDDDNNNNNSNAITYNRKQ